MLQILVWLFYWLMVCVTLLSVLPAENSIFVLLQNKFVRAFIGFLLTSVMRYIYKRYFQTHNFTASVWQGIVCSVVFGCIWAYSLNIYYWLVSPLFNFSAAYAKLPQDVFSYSITLLAWSALYLGVKFGREWQIEREKALQAAAFAQKAQLEMLRYQLNPHFLFNALNSIRASVNEDGNRARQMITQLSDFLRHSLVGVEKKEISLREELEAVRNYLAIEKIRFEDRLEIEYRVDEAAEAFRVPCFLLNPLVENAVKHGMSNQHKTCLRIAASIENHSLQLEVANTGNLRSETKPNGTGIGLKNVRERLEKLFPGRSRFELFEQEGWVRARIVIAKD